jgi:hypothetical protein
LLKTYVSPCEYGRAVFVGAYVAGTFDSLAVAVYSWREAVDWENRNGNRELRV